MPLGCAETGAASGGAEVEGLVARGLLSGLLLSTMSGEASGALRGVSGMLNTSEGTGVNRDLLGGEGDKQSIFRCRARWVLRGLSFAPMLPMRERVDTLAATLLVLVVFETSSS